MDNVDNFYILQVLLVGRVVVGAAIGVASAVVPVYISEVFIVSLSSSPLLSSLIITYHRIFWSFTCFII